MREETEARSSPRARCLPGIRGAGVRGKGVPGEGRGNGGRWGNVDTIPYPSFDARVAAHDEAAAARFAEAEAAKAAGDAKAAIEACLAIRDECYVAVGEAVAKAKALLASYRDDEAV